MKQLCFSTRLFFQTELDADWKQYLVDNIKGGELLVYGEKGGLKD